MSAVTDRSQVDESGSSGTGPVTRAAAARVGRQRRHARRAYLLFILPVAALALLLVAYPIVLSVLQSLRSANSDTFVGLDNYRRFLEDPESVPTILHTFVRGIGGVVPSYLLGLLAALALHQRIRARRTLRILVLVPFVLSAPVGLNMWKLLLNPQSGVPAALGIGMRDLFINPDLVWPALLFINTWASFQFYTMLLLAGLQRIPPELYEAAEMDGAGPWGRFRHVTLPGLLGVSVAACGLHFILSFQEFNLVYITTGGGPLGMTQTLATYAYQKAFKDYDTGYATTLTTVSMIVMIAFMLAVIMLGYLLRWVARTAGPRWSVQWRRRPGGATPSDGRMRRGSRHRHRLATVTAIVLAVFSMLPILFIVSRSLDATPGGAQAVSLLPRDLSLANFGSVLTDPALWSTNNIAVPPLAYNVLNSIIVTLGVTALVLVVSLFAGYALSRWTSRVARGIIAGLVLVQLVPVIVLVFPLYSLFADLGVLGTRFGQILGTSSMFLAMGTLLFKVFFDGMSREIEESAEIDGAGVVRTLWQISRPLAKPAIGALAAYTLINTWNEYLLATTLVSDSASRTFPAALQQYMSSFSFAANNSPGEQAVYLLIPVILAVVLLAFTQKPLAAAYEGGAVKG